MANAKFKQNKPVGKSNFVSILAKLVEITSDGIGLFRYEPIRDRYDPFDFTGDFDSARKIGEVEEGFDYIIFGKLMKLKSNECIIVAYQMERIGSKSISKSAGASRDVTTVSHE